MTKDPVKLFKRVCVIMSVGYAFIGNNGEIDIFVVRFAPKAMKIGQVPKL